MKTFAIAMLAASAAAFDPDFFQGCQKGIFMLKDEQLDNYECPAVVIGEPIQNMLNMV